MLPGFSDLAPGTVGELQHRFCCGLPCDSLRTEIQLMAAFCKVADRVCYGRKLDADAYQIWHTLACAGALGVTNPTEEELLEAAMDAGVERRHVPGELDAKGESHPYEVALVKWGKRLSRHKKNYDAYSQDEEQAKRVDEYAEKLIANCPSELGKARIKSILEHEDADCRVLVGLTGIVEAKKKV